MPQDTEPAAHDADDAQIRDSNGTRERPIEALEEFEPGELRINAVHIGGVADLPIDEAIELRVSGDGLDLITVEGKIMGRLGWPEIDELLVPGPLTRRERRKSLTRLVVQTRHGDASFEVPELSRETLRDGLRPLLAYFHQR